MDAEALEGLAIEAYRRHNLDPARPESTLKLARLEFHADVIHRVANLVGPHGAATGWVHGKPIIAYRRTLPLEEIRHKVGHEMTHLLTRVEHTGDPIVERWCDYGGGCFIAPRPAVLALFKEYGWNIKEIARVCCSSQTWAALRLAEVLLEPIAAVSPAIVRVRGPIDWVWPDEQTIRSWARARRLGPGLRKVAITDRPHRVALVVEE